MGKCERRNCACRCSGKRNKSAPSVSSRKSARVSCRIFHPGRLPEFDRDENTYDMSSHDALSGDSAPGVRNADSGSSRQAEEIAAAAGSAPSVSVRGRPLMRSAWFKE
ncbi:hypothetical protein ebA4698 [Aromatoleum aromaticum EbN1]|uniref:Uncharacterized protein n=1 Tax=Aromatoleum aromaticum (strain DSM 19018 / LMG 30748 / EbN1) TaxID=76114 RepID=Q5P1N6_AROAE|nr:hypothetical protein ebA4698 [Aromatoleum aromaticum EbN1]